MRGVLFCVTHSETVCIWTPIGKCNVIFMLVFNSYFLDTFTFHFSTSIGVQIHLSGKCAVFYSVLRARSAVFYSDTTPIRSGGSRVGCFVRTLFQPKNKAAPPRGGIYSPDPKAFFVWTSLGGRTT